VYMKIGRFCYRKRWAIVIAWFLIVVGINGLSAGLGTGFTDEFDAVDSESARGAEISQEAFGGQGASFLQGKIVVRADSGIDDPAVVDAIEQLAEQAASYEGMTVVSPFDERSGGTQIARTGDFADEIAYISIEGDEDRIDFEESATIGAELLELGESFEESIPGVQVEIAGASFAEFEVPESEIIGISFAIVILIVSFGSVLAMGLPLAVALAGVSVGLGIAGLLSNVTPMPSFATIIGAMIGLGVGIDYALFVVTRYREGLHENLPPEAATVAASDTAGRAVIFAGFTVVVSLLGLLLIGLEFIAGLGIAASVTVAATMVATTTLLPALLGFAQLRVELTRWRGLVAAGLVAVSLLGVGLNAPSALVLVPLALAALTLIAGFFVPILKREVPRREPKPVEQTGWYRWSHMIQDRPWPFLIAGVAILLFLAVPLLDIRLAFSDEGNFAEETTTRQGYDLLSEAFGPGYNGPFIAAARLDGAQDLEVMNAVAAAIGGTEGVAQVGPVIPNDPANPTAALIQITPTTSPQDLETEELVELLRADVIPAAEGDSGVDVALTGLVPSSVDFSDYLGGRSMVFFAVVLVLSFLLLMAVFRSVLVPLKAVIMNLLSIAGAYGAVVALFQWGHLSAVTGVTPGPIEPFVPMMLFAIVFGLSMDYEVFLLSRVKEEYERTGDSRNSVADGLASTARVITAAAAIMVVVFGSFILEDDRTSKLFGVGLSVAVLLDATLVRMLLVPATMSLLGDRNWWIPRWLDRLLPSLHVEGAPDHDERLAEITAEIQAEEAAAAEAPREPVLA